MKLLAGEVWSMETAVAIPTWPGLEAISVGWSLLLFESYATPYHATSEIETPHLELDFPILASM